LADAILTPTREPSLLSSQVQQGPGHLHVTGEWRITNIVGTTSFRPYSGLKLGYRVFLNQQRADVAGTGEKWSENGVDIPPSQRTPITTGSINGDQIAATFIEEGSRRRTTGTFRWRLTPTGNEFTGSFTSTAASSSGSSVGQRNR
jgi:hypothetical protein